MTPQDAQNFIDSPVYKAAMEELERSIVEKLKEVGISETDKRNKLIDILQLKEKLHEILIGFTQEGTVELFNEKQRKNIWPLSKKKNLA